MRYKPSDWGMVALLMRDSTYRLLESLHSGPKSWTELLEATRLSEPGLLKALKELKSKRIVVEVQAFSKTGAKTKRYDLSPKAKFLRIYQAARLLRNKLEKL